MILRVRCCRYLHARSPSDLGCPKSRADLSPFTHTLKSNDLACNMQGCRFQSVYIWLIKFFKMFSFTIYSDRCYNSTFCY